MDMDSSSLVSHPVLNKHINKARHPRGDDFRRTTTASPLSLTLRRTVRVNEGAKSRVRNGEKFAFSAICSPVRRRRLVSRAGRSAPLRECCPADGRSLRRLLFAQRGGCRAGCLPCHRSRLHLPVPRRQSSRLSVHRCAARIPCQLPCLLQKDGRLAAAAGAGGRAPVRLGVSDSRVSDRISQQKSEQKFLRRGAPRRPRQCPQTPPNPTRARARADTHTRSRARGLTDRPNGQNFHHGPRTPSAPRRPPKT